MTTPALRLEGTPSRALGVSLRAFHQAPCVGRGPFLFTEPTFAYRVPAAGGGKDAKFMWTVALNDTAQVRRGRGEREEREGAPRTPPFPPLQAEREVNVGDAIAIWPGLTSWSLNAGCGAVEVVLVSRGDGGSLQFPMKSYLQSLGGESFARGTAGRVAAELGGDGGTWGDAACAKRCGLPAPAKPAPAPAP